MTLVLLFVLNMGVLMGFGLRSLLESDRREGDSTARLAFEPHRSFRDDLLMPIIPSGNRYLH